MSMIETITEGKIDSGPSFDMGGGYKVHLPAPEQENRIGIRVIDWTRLKWSVSEIKRPPTWISNTYSVLFGMAGSGVLTIIPLWSAQDLPNWAMPAVFATTAFSTISAIVLVLLDSMLVKKQEADVNSVLSDMQDIEKPYKHLIL